MNLVIITCAVRTTTSGSCFSEAQRLEQMKLSINSVYAKIPDPYIVILETGSATEEQKNELLPYIHEYHTMGVTTLNKNTGEATMLYKYLESDAFQRISDKVITINKLSGRYFLTDKFSFTRFPISSFVIKICNRSATNILYETRYFRFPISHYSLFFEGLQNIITSPKKELDYNDVEHLFYSYNLFPVDNTIASYGFLESDYIGVAGWIAGHGMYIED